MNLLSVKHYCIAHYLWRFVLAAWIYEWAVLVWLPQMSVKWCVGHNLCLGNEQKVTAVCECVCVCVCIVSIEQRPLQCNRTPALCLGSSSPQTANQSASFLSKCNSLTVHMIFISNDHYLLKLHELHKLHYLIMDN